MTNVPLVLSCNQAALGPRMLDYFRRWHAMWFRVRSCYEMVEEFERENQMKFDLMYRIRPDVVFLKPTTKDAIDAWLQTSTASVDGQQENVVMVPPKSFVTGHMADWVAACQRDNCAFFFNMISHFETCSHFPADENDPCCHDGGKFYEMVQKVHGWYPEESVDSFPVVLLRKDGIDCHRASKFEELMTLCVKIAKKWNKPTPFICDHEGKLVARRTCPR
mmetsp:Transcript_19191/g.26559  ORF Transcript_19191/g.26559 Transcript_19191/m.26559 type:complete len:220 (+) Transcript_19191:8-667(+)